MSFIVNENILPKERRYSHFLCIYISLHIFISLTCYVTLFYFVSLEGGEGIVTANSRDCSANYPNTWGNTSLRSINVYKHSNNMIKIIALQIMQIREGARASWTLTNI